VIGAPCLEDLSPARHGVSCSSAVTIRLLSYAAYHRVIGSG
jgi:hypothetical protein